MSGPGADEKRKTITIPGPQADLFRLRFSFSPTTDPRAIHVLHLRLSAEQEGKLRDRFMALARVQRIVLLEFAPIAATSNYDEVMGLITNELRHLDSTRKR